MRRKYRVAIPNEQRKRASSLPRLYAVTVGGAVLCWLFYWLFNWAAN